MSLIINSMVLFKKKIEHCYLDIFSRMLIQFKIERAFKKQEKIFINAFIHLINIVAQSSSPPPVPQSCPSAVRRRGAHGGGGGGLCP